MSFGLGGGGRPGRALPVSADLAVRGASGFGPDGGVGDRPQNRHVLQTLRAQQLVALRGRRLTLPNLQALEQAALFNPRYLRLGRIGARAEA
ncbi:MULTISPECIES: hypothetical protein [unclassified Methylobacterium]|uniref:hypothetical protein n=1 Tax=unclassified Methylobacterium TaxID=2615210 RepID=UPI0036FBBA45